MLQFKFFSNFKQFQVTKASIIEPSHFLDTRKQQIFFHSIKPSQRFDRFRPPSSSIVFDCYHLSPVQQRLFVTRCSIFYCESYHCDAAQYTPCDTSPCPSRLTLENGSSAIDRATLLTTYHFHREGIKFKLFIGPPLHFQPSFEKTGGRELSLRKKEKKGKKEKQNLHLFSREWNF